MNTTGRGSLRSLADKIANVRNEHDLAALVLDHCPSIFASNVVAIAFFDKNQNEPRMDMVGASDSFLQFYNSYIRATDPLFAALRDQHRAVRDLDMIPHDQWPAIPLYDEVAGHFRVVRCMQGPLLGDGRLVGTLNIARNKDSAFSIEELADLASITTHISVQLMRLRSLPPALDHLSRTLTVREIEVSLLVAKGLTNCQIAGVLDVSVNAIKKTLGKVFQKLEIESRTELVAVLFDKL